MFEIKYGNLKAHTKILWLLAVTDPEITEKMQLLIRFFSSSRDEKFEHEILERFVDEKSKNFRNPITFW